MLRVVDSICQVQGNQGCSTIRAFFDQIIDAENFCVQSEQCICTLTKLVILSRGLFCASCQFQVCNQPLAEIGAWRIRQQCFQFMDFLFGLLHLAKCIVQRRCLIQEFFQQCALVRVAKARIAGRGVDRTLSLPEWTGLVKPALAGDGTKYLYP